MENILPPSNPKANLKDYDQAYRSFDWKTVEKEFHWHQTGKVNIAYEAATADIGDYNLIDPFHQREYRQDVVNYNRDVEVFPVLRRIFEKHAPKDYQVSVTHLGGFPGLEIRAVPETFVLGQDGQLRWHGHPADAEFDRTLAALLTKTPKS